jgi:hypothetical protein
VGIKASALAVIYNGSLGLYLRILGRGAHRVPSAEGGCQMHHFVTYAQRYVGT